MMLSDNEITVGRRLRWSCRHAINCTVTKPPHVFVDQLSVF